MKKNKYIRSDTPIAVIHALNADTSGVLPIALTFGVTICIMVWIETFFHNDSIIFSISELSIIIIISLYLLYYGLVPKRILFFNDGVAGPFFQFFDMIRFPFTVYFIFYYDEIEKIELNYRKDFNRFYIQFQVNNELFHVGLMKGEEKRIYDIMKKIRPSIQITGNIIE